MKTYYVKETDAEGNEVYSPATISPDEIDHEIVKNHPAYQKVLEETIERRQLIRSLKEQLAAKDSQPSDAPQDSKQSQPQAEPTTAPLDENKLIEKVLARLNSVNAEKMQRQEELKSLVAEHKLPSDAIAILEQSQNPKETAAYLGRMAVALSSTGLGDSKAVEPQDIVGLALKKLNLT